VSVEVRRFTEDDWPLLRDLRLRALQESPTAFSSNYGREREFTEADWRRRTASSVVATLDGAPVGIAGSYTEDSAPDIVEVVGMWVAPEARGRGAGGALLDHLIDEARRRGATRVRLGVTEGNETAERLYRSRGFELTGEAEPLLSHPDMCQRTMARAT
jgi:ribosomal protein S18 acetylase RimI-like enzyme